MASESQEPQKALKLVTPDCTKNYTRKKVALFPKKVDTFTNSPFSTMKTRASLSVIYYAQRLLRRTQNAQNATEPRSTLTACCAC